MIRIKSFMVYKDGTYLSRFKQIAMESAVYWRMKKSNEKCCAVECAWLDVVKITRQIFRKLKFVFRSRKLYLFSKVVTFFASRCLVWQKILFFFSGMTCIILLFTFLFLLELGAWAKIYLHWHSHHSFSFWKLKQDLFHTGLKTGLHQMSANKSLILSFVDETNTCR